MSVNSYTGKVSNDAYVLRFSYTGTNLNVPNWKISVRVLGSIVSTDGQNVFPANKINFQPTIVQGQAQPNPIPSVSQIGMPAVVALNEGGEVFLIPQSNAPLYNISQYGSYYNMELFFNLVVSAGAYLNNLQGGYTQKTYTLPLEFKAYGANDELLGTQRANYTIDVFKLIDSPVQENLYSIQISSSARNGLLEVKSLSDYNSGVSVTYQNGLIVSASTDFQITTRSIPSLFTSTSGNTLPLDVVKMQLIPGQNNTSSVTPISLSNNAQIISTGSSTGSSSIYYDIKYSTKPSDLRLIQSVMDEYTTTLLYEITPK